MSNDLANRIANLSPEKRKALLKQVQEQGDSKNQNTVPLVSRDEPLDPSFSQQRLWFVEQLKAVSAAYNMPTALQLQGPLNVKWLAESLRELQLRHEVLRSHFVEKEGKPYIVISDVIPLNLQQIDITDLKEDVQQSRMLELVSEESQRPFDLKQGPLFRATLIRLEEKDHLLVVTIHHIISDEWSVDIFFRELFALYEAREAREVPQLQDLPIQYADFAHWQKQKLKGKFLADQLDYWKKQLSDAPELLELPTDRPRPRVQTFCGASQQHRLSRKLSVQLEELARRENATLFMVLLTGLQTLLMRYSGHEDIVVGTAVAGRQRPELEGLIGFFANTLALRTDLSGNPSFKELLSRTRDVCLGAFSHQDLPFEKLVAELQPTRSMQYSTLFQVMLTLQNIPRGKAIGTGLHVQPLEIDWSTSKFDQTMYAIETEEGIVLSLEYNTDLFDQGTIERMLGHFEALLESAVSDPRQTLSEIPILTTQERQQFRTWTSNFSEVEQLNHPVHRLFERQVRKTPDRPAVVCEDQAITYAELNDRANQLAHHLIQLGVRPRSMVGLCANRSIDLMIGILGILKTGSAYVPLDPDYPANRLSMMLDDAGVDVLVGHSKLLANHALTNLRIIDPGQDAERISVQGKHDPDVALDSSDLAYMMYTSGSTGKPKGVAIPHRAIARLVFGTDFVEFGEDRVFLQLATASFDASTFEFWGALLHGAKLVVSPTRLPSPEQFASLLQQHRVTTFFMTSSLFNQLVDNAPESLAGAKEVIVGGEALSVSHIRKAQSVLGPGVQFFNGYGPTESTTFAVVHRIPADLSPELMSVPIGRPIGNTTTHVLDAHQQQVPIGVPGELYIGGVGLADGYWKRPELTAERFVTDPFSDDPNSRLYRTGDLCRWTSEGTLEFVERLDDQVKLRGFRIELGEIESVLIEHPSLQAAVATIREDRVGDRRLVCYLIADGPRPGIDDIRSYLRQNLPDHMIPSAFMFLDEFPLTPVGKIDRSALPRPSIATAVQHQTESPVDTVERKLIPIWRKALDLETIGVTDDFFELGGHSLLALELFSEIEATFGQKLPLDLLFETPTIRGLAKAIRGDLRGDTSSSIVEVQPQGTRPPLFLVPPSTSPGIVFARLALALGKDQPVYGLTPPLLDDSQPRHWFKKMATHYINEIRKKQPEGPYYLGGRCFGCFVAHEMARQLQQQGEQVAMLLMMDPGGPLVKNLRFRIFRAKAAVKHGWMNLKMLIQRRRIIRYVTIPYHDIEYSIVYPEKRATASQDQLVWDANLRAASEYQMKPVDGRITLLLSTDQASEAMKELWSPLARHGLDYLVVDGSHEATLKEPLVRETARLLRSCLESRCS